MDGNEFFRKLHSFFAGATQEKFEAVFGKMGKHLWTKWTGYYYFSDKSSHKAGFDLLGFIGNLDHNNREMLYQFLATETRCNCNSKPHEPWCPLASERDKALYRYALNITKGVTFTPESKS